MSKIKIKTLGCKVNQYEAETIAEKLAQAGIQVNALHPEDADGDHVDVCIINTCTVTQKASMQSRQAIRRAKRAHPNARIIVTGCYAQTQPQELKALEEVDCVIGQAEKHLIPELIIACPAGQKKKLPPLPLQNQTNAKFDAPPPIISRHRSRPFLKIQDGCDAFCTYCIVPYARGRSRSMPFDEALARVGAIKAAGYHEVVLSGIHLGCFGQDLTPPRSLGDLLHQITVAQAIDRVRLSSIEPAELTDTILDLAVKSETICRHFHIPLQSGDDAILKQMHRPYDGRFFADLVTRIHSRMPDACIGVDTLIGFPGETDRAFENTYRLVEELPIAYLHVFPYSPRKGTPAGEFAGQVPAATIKARTRVMRALGRQKRAAFYRRHLHLETRALIEARRDRASGRLKGITGNYIPVLLEGPDSCMNTLQPVRIEKIGNDGQISGRLSNPGTAHYQSEANCPSH